MRRVLYSCALAVLVGVVPALAQDAKIKSETKIKADDAEVVSMTGCLEGGPSLFRLSRVVLTRDNAKRVLKVVGTTGSSYELTPHAGVNLIDLVDRQVEVTGVMVPAATHHDRHAKVEVKQKTEVDVEHAPNRTSESESKAEIAKADHPTFSVVSVKQIGATCVR